MALCFRSSAAVSAKPATFQLLMQVVLRGLEQFASPYIDNVVFFSVTWEDHLQHIDTVLSRLSEYDLTVKLSKCSWVEFLGYVVGEGHLSIPLAWVRELQSYVRPRTVSQLRSFLGQTTNYS